MIEKSAVITIAGRPNVGKSTLANALAGEKVAIVTDKPQTTRSRIRAVLNRGDTQFVFVDTPGYHRPRTKLGDYMVKVIRQNMAEVDCVMLLVEPVSNVGEQERQLIRWIASGGAPAVLIINKIDKVKKTELLAVMEAYSRVYAFNAIVPISARSGEGMEALLDALAGYAVPGPQFFPDGMASDQPERQIVAEIVREKLLMNLDKEIPHGTAVEVTRFSQREDEIIDLDVTIYCEKASHKGIIIGEKGAVLKKIGEQSRVEIEKFMGAKVFLQTWVKVREKWRDSKSQIKNFGYGESR